MTKKNSYNVEKLRSVILKHIGVNKRNPAVLELAYELNTLIEDVYETGIEIGKADLERYNKYKEDTAFKRGYQQALEDS